MYFLSQPLFNIKNYWSQGVDFFQIPVYIICYVESHVLQSLDNRNVPCLAKCATLDQLKNNVIRQELI